MGCDKNGATGGVNMKVLAAVAVLLVIGYTSAKSWSFGNTEDINERFKRASFKQSAQQADKCPAGTKAVISCEPCPIGYHASKEGLWKDCVPCDPGMTTVEGDGSKCVKKCDPGKTWDAGRKKCVKCGSGMVKAADGNQACQACPKYYSPNKQATDCGTIRCPAGFEPSNNTEGALTCAPCKLGYFKKKAGGETDFCVRCKKDRWTLATGSTGECLGKISNEACKASFAVLAQAVEDFAKNMTDNETVLEAVCKKAQDIDFAALKAHFDNCKDIVDDKSGQPMLPSYIDDTKNLTLADAFSGGVPSCPSVGSGSEMGSSSGPDRRKA